MSKLSERNLRFETKQLHIGQENPDPVTDARAVPIYATTSYVFHDSQHAADRFGLRDAGNIYGRLTNPTQDVFERRIAALEGGSAALAVASGAAAISYTIQALAKAGENIVAAETIYGGTYNLLAHTLPNYGITTKFVDPDAEGAFESAIDENTRAIYIETLGNPNSNIIDIEALAKLAHGVTDSSVTMAAKAHLRNGRPVVIALSTNDGLSGSAENIARLLNRKNYYFVPFGQDDPEKKPCSLQADFSRLSETVEAALGGEQLQPILRR